MVSNSDGYWPRSLRSLWPFASFWDDSLSLRRPRQLPRPGVPRTSPHTQRRCQLPRRSLSSEKERTAEQHHLQAGSPGHPAAVKPNLIASGGPHPTKPAAAVSAPGRKESPTEFAALAPPQTVSSAVEGDRSIQAAPAKSHAMTPVPRRTVNLGGAGVGTTSGLRSVVAPHSGDGAASTLRAGHLPAVPAPNEVRLDAGTRIWITLQSVRQRADGVSEFRGILLLPVVQSGTTLLDRSNPISGTVSVAAGKTTVQITEFVSNGARYLPSTAAGEANTLPGTGPAVKFDAGKVLETWIVSASVFSKQPEDARPSAK